MKRIIFLLIIASIFSCQKGNIAEDRNMQNEAGTFLANQNLASRQKATIDLSNANIIADGNSYVQATGTYTPFPSLISNALGVPVKNFGFGGQTTQQMINKQSQVIKLYNPSKVNIVLVVEGGNDIFYYMSAAEAHSRYKTYCNAARAAGFKVIVSTTIPRQQNANIGSMEQFVQELGRFNQLIIKDNSFYDGIIRPDLEPIFSNYNAGGYDSDHIHPNNTGYQKFSELFIAAMNEL